MLEAGEETSEKITRPVGRRRTHKSVGLDTTRLKKMIVNLMDSLENKDSTNKASVGELLKLLQVYKELTAVQIKEVEVRWVDRLRVDGESET